MKILLLQARTAVDPMREHEYACFVTRTGLSADAIVSHDLCEGPPTLTELSRFDAMMVGGSGDFYVSKENLPHFEGYLDFLREVVEVGHPTFASCFGFQSLVRALGGDLIHDTTRTEVGTFEVRLTDDGMEDPLLGKLPGRFQAQLGHTDRATSLAPGVAHLASSQLCEFQALRIPDKPIWGTQFHPELDRQTNLDRYRAYLANYGPRDDAEQASVESGFRDSPEASGLLRDFIDLVFF